MAIKISVAGLAKFMRATASRQRSMLKDYKFPFTKDGKRKPQIVRHSEARAAVIKYHSSGNDISILEKAVEELAETSEQHPEKDTSRFSDNVRAIKTYVKYYKDRKFVVLTHPKPKYIHGEVEVSTSFDLYVEEEGTKKLIKLDFNNTKPNEEDINVILKVTHEASIAKELGVQAKNVIYLDVIRQQEFSGKKLNTRLKRDIDAACDTIADIWPKVKQS